MKKLINNHHIVIIRWGRMNTKEKLKNIANKIMENFYQDPKAVSYAMMGVLGDENVLLYGPTGTGKTTLAEQIISAIYSIPTQIVNESILQGGVTNPVTLFGAPNVKKLKEGEYETVLRKSPFLYVGRIIDEVNRADEETQNILLPLLDNRKAIYINGELKPIDQSIDYGGFIATANLNGIGTHQVSEQLMNRFGISIYLKDRITANVKVKDGRRETLEDILGDGVDKNLVEEFKENLDNKEKLRELREKFSEKYGTISPEELDEIRKKANEIGIPDQYLLPLAYVKAILSEADVDHVIATRNYLKYVKPIELGARIEETMKKVLPLYLLIKGEGVNEKSVKNAIFKLLPYAISSNVEITDKAVEYLNDKKQAREIDPGYINSDEGKRFFITKHVINQLKNDYNSEKEKIRETIRRIYHDKKLDLEPDRFDHPLIRRIVQELKEMEEDDW